MNFKALIAALLVAAPAVAENDFTHTGAYVQGAGYGLYNSFVNSLVPSDVSPKGTGFGGTVGYRFMRWYAVQVDYLWGKMEDSGSYEERGHRRSEGALGYRSADARHRPLLPTRGSACSHAVSADGAGVWKDRHHPPMTVGRHPPARPPGEIGTLTAVVAN